MTTARDVNRRIKKLGGIEIRQVGSHRLFRVTGVDDVSLTTIVAQHPGDIPKGTLHKIQKDLEPVFGKGGLI